MLLPGSLTSWKELTSGGRNKLLGIRLPRRSILPGIRLPRNMLLPEIYEYSRESL